MRASGNLAGVEFIAPPKHHRHRTEWEEIITESGYFFTKSVMRFFGCRVAWDSLTKIDQETFGFITSEQDSVGAWGGQRRYTVRKWDKENGTNHLSQFGEFDTMAQAKTYLIRGGFLVNQ